MQINKIKIGKRFRKEFGELETLKNSIKEIGLLQPVVIDENNNLIAGQRRLMACKELGETDIKVNIIKIQNALRGEYDENVVRKSFAPSEKLAIWEAVESFQHKRSRRSVSEQRDRPIKQASKFLKTSTDTLSKIKQVVDFGDKEIIREMDDTNNIKRACDKIKEHNRKKDIQKKAVDLPKSKFQVIYADPCWQYNNSGFQMSAEKQYPTMSVEQLSNLRIKGLADDNCIIFLWATNPLLQDALKVMQAWGFEYKTNFVYCKKVHTAGFYVFGQHELLLIGVKGSMLPIGDKPKSIITGDNKIHSKKPQIVYEIIEKMYPELKYIELFARNKRKNWISWGLETEKYENN